MVCQLSAAQDTYVALSIVYKNAALPACLDAIDEQDLQ